MTRKPPTARHRSPWSLATLNYLMSQEKDGEYVWCNTHDVCELGIRYVPIGAAVRSIDKRSSMTPDNDGFWLAVSTAQHRTVMNALRRSRYIEYDAPNKRVRYRLFNGQTHEEGK